MTSNPIRLNGLSGPKSGGLSAPFFRESALVLRENALAFLAAVFSETEEELILTDAQNRILAAGGKYRSAAGEFFTPEPEESAVKRPVNGPNGERLGYLIFPGRPADRLDPLTALPDRRCFERRYECFIQKRSQSGEPFALAFLDLDQFKPVNDTYGHWAGDQVLIQFAARLRKKFRSADLVARYGGDEFAVLSPNCPPSVIQERIRDLLEDLKTNPVQVSAADTGETIGQTGGKSGTGKPREGGTAAEAGKPSEGKMAAETGKPGEEREKTIEIPLSFSFGVIAPFPNESFSGAIRRVDAELYRMKNRGNALL